MALRRNSSHGAACSCTDLAASLSGLFRSGYVGSFHRAEDFSPVAKEDNAPTAFHPGCELLGAVFAGAAGWHCRKIETRVS
jgi:hypothetical protein